MADSVEYWTTQKASHCFSSFYQASSSTTPTLRPNIVTGRSISGRELPYRMNHGSPIITYMEGSGYITFEAKGCSLKLQQVIHKQVLVLLWFGKSSHWRLWYLYFSGTDHGSCRVSEHHCGRVSSLHVFCFRTRNGLFQHNKATYCKERIVLENYII